MYNKGVFSFTISCNFNDQLSQSFHRLVIVVFDNYQTCSVPLISIWTSISFRGSLGNKWIFDNRVPEVKTCISQRVANNNIRKLNHSAFFLYVMLVFFSVYVNHSFINISPHFSVLFGSFLSKLWHVNPFNEQIHDWIMCYHCRAWSTSCIAICKGYKLCAVLDIERVEIVLPGVFSILFCSVRIL